MNLPTQIFDIIDRSRSWWDEAPPTQRYGVMGFGALLVIVVIFAAISGIGDEEGAWEGRILYANLEFEEAAHIRDQIAELKRGQFRPVIAAA